MLGDWSGVDVEKALDFVASCRVRFCISIPKENGNLMIFVRRMKEVMVRVHTMKHMV